MGTKIPLYTVQLPPTPCTPKMRKEIVAMAEKEGQSLAEIQRRAFSFFLEQKSSNAKESTIKTDTEGVGQ